MAEVERQRQIEALQEGLKRQKAIFNKYAGRVINPDNSEEYQEAKKKFDEADRRIKAIEKELARLIAGEEPEIYEPSIFEKMFHYLGKLGKDDDDKDSVALGVRG